MYKWCFFSKQNFPKIPVDNIFNKICCPPLQLDSWELIGLYQGIKEYKGKNITIDTLIPYR